MSLKAECEAVIKQFTNDVPQEVMDSLTGFIGRLVESGLAENAINVGDKAPEFNLPDIHGKQTKLSDLLEQGPVVINYYRGGYLVRQLASKSGGSQRAEISGCS